jgi:predicted RNase H-like HicB family nuclease
MVGAPSVTPSSSLPSYRVSLVRVADGNGEQWLAEVDGLPGCSSRGATPEEAAGRAWAAVQDLVDPSSGEERQARPTRHSGKLLVRMPATLHDELARAAEAEGVSLNQLITGVLAGAVEWRSRDEAEPREGADGDASGRTARLGVTVLAANFAVVLLVAVVAIAVLLTAWRG